MKLKPIYRYSVLRGRSHAVIPVLLHTKNVNYTVHEDAYRIKATQK